MPFSLICYVCFCGSFCFASPCLPSTIAIYRFIYTLFMSRCLSSGGDGMRFTSANKMIYYYFFIFLTLKLLV